MDLKAEKIELVKLILDTEDRNLLQEIIALFKFKEEDFWETLPEHVKEAIRQSQEELKRAFYFLRGGQKKAG